MARKREVEGCEANMTPMIDVVFQLIIFFIVTINMSEAKDKDVRLELSEHGEEVDTSDTNISALIIDVSRKGRISISDQTTNAAQIREIVRRRYARQGDTFQVWVRGDARTEHRHIRTVMDACTEAGVARVTFIAVKDVRTPEMREFISTRRR